MADEQAVSAPALTRNPISVFGAWLTTLSAFAFIAYYVAEALELLRTPYAGLLGFVAVPALFVLGLLLIPLGMWREARRRRRGLAAWRWPALDLNRSETRRVMIAIGVLTIVNLAIVGLAGMGAVHYMETDNFCGQVCHTPMRPQFTAHQVAPHAGVECVQCHVAPGAKGMVRAKMNGARQAYEFVTHSFQRPIPSGPARNIPVAAETCLQCHSNGYPTRDVVKTTFEYANDEEVSETVSTLTHFTAKNHWHTRDGRSVEYVAADPKRAAIPYVKVTEADGKVTEYFTEKVTAAPAGEARKMDCLDCHSRPAHRFASSAEVALDEAIGRGEIPRTLPYLRREILGALKASYATENDADAGIRTRLLGFYKPADAARTAEIDRIIASAARLYRANNFNDMKITWGTYNSHIGHSETDGCFRCHDDEHKSRDGRVIKQDCELCHK